MTPKKPDWFELTDGEDSPANVRKINKKLPFAALVAAGAIVLGGSIFATAHDEPSAVADTPTASQSAIASASPNISSTPSQSPSGVNALPVPNVTNPPQLGDGDLEGRDRGDHHDGDRFEHDND
jgi:hypothetical protein